MGEIKGMSFTMLFGCSFLVIFALVMGCASIHRPEFYERTGSEKTMEIVGSTTITQGLSVYSTTARYLRVYPECKEFNTSQGDLMSCIKEIDIKEGRLKSWDQSPINKESAIKELEVRKSDVKTNEEALQNQFAASKTSSSDNIDLTAKSHPPISKKPQVSAPIAPTPALSSGTAIKQCRAPIWNIGDFWKFGSGEIKLIRVEENLYIAENSSSSDLAAYDKNTLEKTFSIDDKGGRVKIESSFPIYFDFPLYVGKKWKRHFSARPSFATRYYNYLMEYKVLRIEDITVSAGTFKAFKIEINHTNYEAKVSGKAHIWYSPKVKLFVKVALDGSSYWRGAQGFELMSFNLKDKEKSPKEIKLPLEKVDIPPQVQPTLVEKQKVAPPIAPSLSTHEQGVDIPSKSQLPVTEKKKVPAFAPPPQSSNFVVVAGTSANIRTGAGNEFPIVTTVNQGAKLTLLGEYGKWFNVRLENGQEGWINSRFVQE